MREIRVSFRGRDLVTLRQTKTKPDEFVLATLDSGFNAHVTAHDPDGDRQGVIQQTTDPTRTCKAGTVILTSRLELPACEAAKQERALAARAELPADEDAKQECSLAAGAGVKHLILSHFDQPLAAISAPLRMGSLAVNIADDCLELFSRVKADGLDRLTMRGDAARVVHVAAWLAPPNHHSTTREPSVYQYAGNHDAQWVVERSASPWLVLAAWLT